MRSRYCTTLQIPTGGETRRLTYSSLSGNVALVDELCVALFDHAGDDLRRDELAPAELAAVDERLAFLADRGFSSPSLARTKRSPIAWPRPSPLFAGTSSSSSSCSIPRTMVPPRPRSSRRWRRSPPSLRGSRPAAATSTSGSSRPSTRSSSIARSSVFSRSCRPARPASQAGPRGTARAHLERPGRERRGDGERGLLPPSGRRRRRRVAPPCAPEMRTMAARPGSRAAMSCVPLTRLPDGGTQAFHLQANPDLLV